MISKTSQRLVSAAPASAASEPSAGSAGLWSNDRGAIMVMGVFMAIVLVGLLYYIAGVGQMVFRRERMQDAADAVALATAIGHARGMNLIAFINMVMAGLVAIVLALKIIELMLTGLALILVAISWLVPPAAAAVPIVNEVRSVVKEVHDAAREIVDNILVGLNMAERAIAIITPAESVLTATLKVTEKYSDVVDTAVAVPVRLTLPVENDEYNTLCDRAEGIIKQLVTKTTDGVPFVGKVISLAVGALVSAVKNAYCYQNGTKVPSTPIHFDRSLPFNDKPGKACEDDYMLGMISKNTLWLVCETDQFNSINSGLLHGATLAEFEGGDEGIKKYIAENLASTGLVFYHGTFGSKLRRIAYEKYQFSKTLTKPVEPVKVFEVNSKNLGQETPELGSLKAVKAKKQRLQTIFLVVIFSLMIVSLLILLKIIGII